LETTPNYTLKNDFQTILRVSKDFSNDRLTLTFLGSMFGLDSKKGAFQRFSMEYDFTDTWSVLSGIVLYQSGDKIEMKKNGANDRIFLNLKYSFFGTSFFVQKKQKNNGPLKLTDTSNL